MAGFRDLRGPTGVRGQTVGQQDEQKPYKVHLRERLLPGSNKTAMEKVVGLPKSRCNFSLIANNGKSFACHKELLQSTCSSINVSNRWELSEMRLNVDDHTTAKIAHFALSGRIEIDNDCIVDLMAAADFLGFESLLKLCVKHIARAQFPAHKFVDVHALFSHVDGMSAAFFKKLNRMPLDFFPPRNDPSALLALNLKQLKSVLASDGLMVRSEDRVVDLIAQWSAHHEATLEDKESCLDLIRYPLLSRAMVESHAAVSLGLPRPDTMDFSDGVECRARAGFDKHVHILWKEHRGNVRGSESISVSCLTWNKHHKILAEEKLFCVANPRNEEEQSRCAEIGVAGGKIVKVAPSKSRKEIFISQLDLEQQSWDLKSVIRSSDEELVFTFGIAILKGTSDCSVSIRDDRTRVVSLDTESWEASSDSTLNRGLGNIPFHPWELQRFDDCAVAIINHRLFIGGTDFTEVNEVPMPEARGNYLDFERIGNELFVLEGGRRFARYTDPNVVHCVDIEKRVFKHSRPLPVMEERLNLYEHSSETSKKFLRINSELFVVIQAESDEPLHIFSYDLTTHESKVVATLEAPKPDPDDRESVHARLFLCAVPAGLMPCDRTQLKDLRASRKTQST